MTRCEPGPLASAWAEARRRVFGGGFDRAFRFVLIGAYVAGALFLSLRGGAPGIASILAGFIAMALFLAMPVLTIFSYLFALTYLARQGGVPDDADPPLRLVFVALAIAIMAASLFVWAAFSLPVAGAQLRLIFS